MDDTQKSLEPEKRINTLKGQRRKINTPDLLIKKKRSKEHHDLGSGGACL